MPYPIASFLDWLRWQAAGLERPPIGTPPARVEILTARGKRVLTTKRARTVSAAGRRLAGDESSHEHK